MRQISLNKHLPEQQPFWAQLTQLLSEDLVLLMKFLFGSTLQHFKTGSKRFCGPYVAGGNHKQHSPSWDQHLVLGHGGTAAALRLGHVEGQGLYVARPVSKALLGRKLLERVLQGLVQRSPAGHKKMIKITKRMGSNYVTEKWKNKVLDANWHKGVVRELGYQIWRFKLG